MCGCFRLNSKNRGDAANFLLCRSVIVCSVASWFMFCLRGCYTGCAYGVSETESNLYHFHFLATPNSDAIESSKELVKCVANMYHPDFWISLSSTITHSANQGSEEAGSRCSQRQKESSRLNSIKCAALCLDDPHLPALVIQSRHTLDIIVFRT